MPGLRGTGRIHRLSIRRPQVAREVLELQRAAYRVEASLVGFDDLPPLRETLEALRGSGETFFGYFEGERLLGAVSFRSGRTTLDIHRLMVSPAFFRRGIGTDLLRFVESIAGVRRIRVSTARGNEPALQLYKALGFSEVGSKVVSGGLHIVSLAKEPAPFR